MRLVAIVTFVLLCVGCGALQDLAGEAKDVLQDAKTTIQNVKEITDSVKLVAKAAADGASNNGWTGAMGAIGGALVAGGGAGLALRRKAAP